MSTLTKRLLSCYTSAIHDVMVAQGYNNFVLPRAIRPLLPSQRLSGPIYTVSGNRHEDIVGHDTYLAWTELLGSVPSGHVLVCQPNDDELAYMGELSAEVLQQRGILGYVADGGCRDVDMIQKSGFSVYCRYFTPTDIVGRWLPERMGEAIRIGDVDISTGDYLLADDDGIVAGKHEVDGDDLQKGGKTSGGEDFHKRKCPSSVFESNYIKCGPTCIASWRQAQHRIGRITLRSTPKHKALARTATGGMHRIEVRYA